MDLSSFGQTNQAVSEDTFSISGDDGSSHFSVGRRDGMADPRLVYQSDRTAIYCHNDKGIKVCVDPDPSKDRILQLVHEHNVSRSLPAACRRRRTIDVKSFKGDPALYFRWTRGATLAEWLRMARQRSDMGLDVRLQVAISIVETLHSFHDAGVIYNNLLPSNIVLDAGICATLIDLSEAWVYSNKDEKFSAHLGETDLHCLGWILNELFCPDDQTNSSNVARGPNNDCLPIYLGTLICSLLRSGGGGDQPPTSSQRCYDRAWDVLSDLKEAERKPQIFLKPPVLDELGHLRLPADAFYGRQSEVSMLLNALSSVRTHGGQPMLVSVSGLPGTGKTSLVNQIERPLKDCGGFFVRAKFDERIQTDSVIFSALDRFYSGIVEGGGKDGCNHDWKETTARIYKSLGPGGCRSLTKSIPSLQALMQLYDIGNDDSANKPVPAPSDLKSYPVHRKYLLCKLVAATSSQLCPLAIFWDDLQWADETSLDVIRILLTDPEIRYCLFIGVYRDNQSSFTARLNKLLRGVQEQGVSLMSIRIGPIERDCINMLLSETMCLPPRLSRPLSTIIHNKTSGISLFVMRFLRSLNEEGLLWFDMSSRIWEYDYRGIELKEISKDVIEHMSERMKHLPQEIQLGLKLSAYLGSKFHAKALEKGIPENDIDITGFLRFSVEGGYTREVSRGIHVWAHDQIQQAAYELIPESKREYFHLLLGSRIFLRTTPDELDEMIFYIVGNMNIGARLIKSQKQMLEVVRLNLRAGECAIASSSFQGAVSYLMKGVSLLPDDSWEEDYDLTIRLYDSATEALYVTGDYETLSEIIQIPLCNARGFEDKLNSYHILVRVLVSSCQMREGIAKSVSVLAQLGEPIPTRVDADIYAAEVRHVKRSLMNLTEDNLLNLPLMTDERKLSCMKFLSDAVAAAFQVEPLLAPVIVFRMVRLSILHGVCNVSAFAFGLYGAWLVSAINSDFEGGYSMGHLAISLMKRLDAKEFIPRVYTAVYSFINIWKEPFQASLGKHLEGYDAGALSGDIEFATSCLYQYSLCALNNCGEDLRTLEKTVRLYIRRSIQWNQTLQMKSLVLLHDHTLKLMGSNESSYSTFLDSGEGAVYEKAAHEGENNVCRYILHKRKLLAFFYGDMDGAAQSFELGKEYHTGANGRLSHICSGIVIDGLIAFFFARKHGEDKNYWQNIGEAVIDVTKQWAMNSSWNFINKLYLLEAEYFFTKNDQTEALKKYKQSIKAANDHHFIHEEGLAHERAAQFHLKHGRNEEALVCLYESKRCYHTWCAHGLVTHIERLIVNLT